MQRIVKSLFYHTKTDRKFIGKEVIVMVNEDKEKFIRIQQQHKSHQSDGTGVEQKRGFADPKFEGNNGTDVAPGAEGRKYPL